MDEINKNRHNKEQRAKYSTADIISPVKESGVAVNAPYEKSKDVKKQHTKFPRDGGNKSRQREIKKRFGFLRNVFYYSSGIK